MTTEHREKADVAPLEPDRPVRATPPANPDREKADVAPLEPHRPVRRSGGAAEQGVWREVARLATRQGGYVHRTQCRRAGLSRNEVRRATLTGRLFPRDGELFLVGHEAPCLDAQLHRALLLAGTGGIISHRTAAWVWGLWPEPSRLEVTVPSNRRSRRRVGLHQARLHPRRDVTYRRGFAMTSLRRTIIDCAAVMREEELARLVNEAAIRGWLHARNADALRAMVHGRRGARRLRRVLEARDLSRGWTRSTLERAFADAVRDAGLPPYQRGRLIDIGGGELRECDVLWPEQRVMVELDFLPIHETGRVPYRDRRRDRRLGAAGWTIIRLTGDDLAHHLPEVLEDLRRALGITS